MSRPEVLVALVALAVWGLTVMILGLALMHRWSRATARRGLRASVDVLHARFARVEVALDDLAAELARLGERDACRGPLADAARVPGAGLQARLDA